MRLLNELQQGSVGGDELTRLRNDVRAHVEELLRARPGMALGNPSYGFSWQPALQSSEPFAQALTASLLATIRRHEPRLREATLQAQRSNEPTKTRFELHGALSLRGRARAVRFEITLYRDGSVDVR